MTIKDVSDNAYDIGMVEGVLHGIELTATLLPNQKEAIVAALKAIYRIGERHQHAVEQFAKVK